MGINDYRKFFVFKNFNNFKEVKILFNFGILDEQ